MKKIIFILFGVLLTLNASIAQAQTTTLYTDLLSWEAMVLNPEVLITTSTNIALADEVSSPPGYNKSVGSILTFDSANTGLSRSFRVETLEAGSEFIFNTPGVCPTCWQNALNIGGVSTYTNDNWQLSLLNGATMTAFAVEIRDNQFEPGESISFYSKNTLMDTIDISTFGSHEFYFIGVTTDYTFDTVVFNEASGGENMGVADFRFGPSITVNIDIIPNRANNRINVCRCGKVQVAILSIETFYAPDMVVLNSLTFGSTGNEESLAFCRNKLRDINRDGYLDLVCFFKMPYTGFKCGDTEGILKGQTVGGIPFEARDSISPIPCR